MLPTDAQSEYINKVVVFFIFIFYNGTLEFISNVLSSLMIYRGLGTGFIDRLAQIAARLVHQWNRSLQLVLNSC